VGSSDDFSPILIFINWAEDKILTRSCLQGCGSTYLENLELGQNKARNGFSTLELRVYHVVSQ